MSPEIAHTVDVDGPVHVLDFSSPNLDDQTPVVLVHGLDGSAANWLDVGPALGTRAPTVAIDLPGFGRTPLAGRRPSIDRQADLVAEVTRQLFGRPVHLVGNSMGAVVVLQAAARHRDLAASVTLVAPAVPRAGRGPIAWSFVPWVVPFWLGVGSAESRRRMDQDAEARVRGLLDLCYAKDSTTNPETFLEMVDVARQRDRKDAVRAWTGSARDLFGRLANRRGFHRMAATVTAPVHLVEGGADPVIPATSVADAVARHGWHHTTLPGVGHAPMLEAPIETLAALDLLLRGGAAGAVPGNPATPPGVA